MSISSRIHDTIEGWVVEWRDRLRGWLATSLLSGVERAFDFFEPGLKEEITPSMNRLLEMEGMPDDIKNILTKATTAPGAFQFLALLPYLIGILIGLGMGAAAPMARIGAHQVDKLVKSFRMDPLSIITAWRRDPEAYEHMFQDLKDQGWNDDRIEALKFLTLYMPSAAEIVHWYAREVYEPEMIERYGLDSETPPYMKTDFPKIGVDKTQADHHWHAHWEHASYMQVREMLHRGVLSLDKTMPAPPTTKGGWAARDAEGIKAAFDWYRLVEIPPFWRARLTEMMFEVPTRVDVRRWWDMRTINEAELYNIYHRQGYHGTDLDNYVLWTKVYVAFPDLMARWTKGWIKEGDVRAELIALGMPPARVEEMIQTKIKPTEQEPISEAKKVTQTAIIKWVKVDPVARWEEGIDLLMDLGYDENGARFVLDAYIAEMGSPETYEDWKKITSEYRQITGRPGAPMPEELRAAAAELVKVKLEVDALERAVTEERRRLTAVEEVPDAASKKLKQLQVTLNRARAELQRVQLNYDSLVAQWKHGLE